MLLLQLIPITLSLLLLAAHFLRGGQLVLVVLTLLVMALYAVRRPLANWILQGVLIVGTLEWVRTTVEFVSMRTRAGEPWVRLAVILITVTAFTLVSGLLLNSLTLRRWYRI